MARKVTVKGAEGGLTTIVVDGYHEMTVLEFISAAVNDHRDRFNRFCTDNLQKIPRHKIKVPSRPEPSEKRERN